MRRKCEEMRRICVEMRRKCEENTQKVQKTPKLEFKIVVFGKKWNPKPLWGIKNQKQNTPKLLIANCQYITTEKSYSKITVIFLYFYSM